jgi:hypothetical protein
VVPDQMRPRIQARRITLPAARCHPLCDRCGSRGPAAPASSTTAGSPWRFLNRPARPCQVDPPLGETAVPHNASVDSRASPASCARRVRGRSGLPAPTPRVRAVLAVNAAGESAGTPRDSASAGIAQVRSSPRVKPGSRDAPSAGMGQARTRTRGSLGAAGGSARRSPLHPRMRTTTGRIAIDHERGPTGGQGADHGHDGRTSQLSPAERAAVLSGPCAERSCFRRLMLV